MKISQLPYVRPEKEVVINNFKVLQARLAKATNYAEVKAIVEEYNTQIIDLSSMYALAFTRFTQNTADEYYLKEQEFWDENLPEMELAESEFLKDVIKNKFVDELRKDYPTVWFKNTELKMRGNDERITAIKVEINKLVSEYTRTMSGITVEFRGEQLTPAAMGKYMTSNDRETRREATLALGNEYTKYSVQLDELFDKLTALRTKSGREMGFDNFCPIGYGALKRNCYGKEEVAKFRENVKKYIVPLVAQLKERVRLEQGWDKIMSYDDGIYTKEEPKPIGTPEEIFEKGKQMYKEMSPVASNLFNHMCEDEAFDALSRKNKFGGGYCISIDKFKTPFILANFNGSQGDIEVLTHEFGHALAADRSFEYDFQPIREPSMETAEVHSMSMEFLAYPWMENFFGDKTDMFKFSHMSGALAFLPYGTIVDYFQQTIYDNPDMTPAERNAFWLKIEKEFKPYMSNEGLPFYSEGRRWQRQAHIFETPFYYIDYCLAQFTAFQILAIADKDYKKAQDVYMKFLVQAGTKPFTELLSSVGLLSPFEEASFVEVANVVKKMLKLK